MYRNNSYKPRRAGSIKDGSSFRRGSRGGSPSSGRQYPYGGRFSGFSRGRSIGQSIDISKFINKAEITEKTEAFVPEHSFADFKISDVIKANVAAKGYKDPTPIQDRIIPHILKGSDVVGIANTGTGKTGAYLIPLIDRIAANRREKILIVVPTRELAIQIDQEFQDFSRKMKMFSVCCVGGAPIGYQIRDLKYLNNFIIGTPGRLKDLAERQKIDFSEFNTIVLDEADRMLDMGFINDVRLIVSKMPEKRHTLFFSATMSREIERLIGEFLRAPVIISVKTRDTAKNVEQDIVRVNRDNSKIEILHDLLNKPEFNKVLVFGKTKHGVERLSRNLVERGFKADSIHGDKNHSQRQKALKLFKESYVQILVATDVAARGLDIPNVSHVINYDIPATYDDYVHRIGRTGRGEKMGKALTFVE